MNKKFTSTFIIVLILLFTSSVLFSQQSQSNRPQSSGNKYNIYRSHNSTISNPADVQNYKKEITHKNTRKTNYKKDKHNITKSENYFHIDKSGKTLWDGKHWELNEFPLKVYVKEADSKYFKSSYKEYITYAFKIWQKADERIDYTFTNNSRNADIEFVFEENLGKKYEENYLGLTEYDTNRNNEIGFSKVQISLLKFGKEKISAGEIKATIIHELGHAFGLGHSDNETDIMYPYINPDQSSEMTYNELSRGDKEAIKDVIDLGKDHYVWK